MKKQSFFFILITLSLIACSRSPRAVTHPDGTPINLYLLFDASWEQVDESNENAVSQRRQIESYYKSALPEAFTRAGYNPTLIDSFEQIENPEYYVVDIKLSNYDPGSAAARMLVGFGAGAASMDTRARLGKAGQKLWEKHYSYGTSQNWKKLVKKTNKVLLQDLSKAITN